MTTTVRRLGGADWEAMRELRLRSLLDSPDAFLRSHAEESAYGEEVWRSRLGDDTASFLAEVDGKPAGRVSGIPSGPDERDPEAAMMVGMWVDPAARGRGVAGALTDALVEWARDAGYRRLVLWVYDAEGRAGSFYRKAGFVPTGRTDTFESDPRPLHFMSMELAR